MEVYQYSASNVAMHSICMRQVKAILEQSTWYTLLLE